ncbi:MAG: DNA-binding domain-containing protein [Burkholderiaceae bacterium]|nr:DNA-binding domain-containing protein [Burkholderiaceae bacterium]
MTQLHTLQGQFQGALLQDQPAVAGLLAANGDAQFGVYRNAYRARLRAALRDNFEVLPLVMGDEAFDALAHAYIAAHPSRHYSLRWFGHQLCAFMADNDALLDHPAMLDLARMEWALRQAFDAAPAALLAPAELAAVPPQDWAELQFTLHPSVQLLDLHWAVGPVWHAMKSGQADVPPPEAVDHAMLVWRQGMNTQWKSLSQTEAVFVQSLIAGQRFGAVCQALAQRVGEDAAAPTAVSLLSQLLSTGAICALPLR